MPYYLPLLPLGRVRGFTITLLYLLFDGGGQAL